MVISACYTELVTASTAASLDIKRIHAASLQLCFSAKQLIERLVAHISVHTSFISY
jgi:hypothetical protein